MRICGNFPKVWGGGFPYSQIFFKFFTKNSELFVKTKIELQNIPQILLVYRVLPNPEGGGSAKLKLNSREIPPQLNQPSVFLQQRDKQQASEFLVTTHKDENCEI